MEFAQLNRFVQLLQATILLNKRMMQVWLHVYTYV